MVAVGDLRVTAVRTVHVAFLVATSRRRASFGMSCVNLDHMLVYVSCMGMVQVAIVQVVRVAIVLDGYVSTTRAMLMAVTLVYLASFGHDDSPGWRSVIFA